MIDASAGLTTASCPRCDLLFSVQSPPTLTDAEREAIECAVLGDDSFHAAALRGLLERMK